MPSRTTPPTAVPTKKFVPRNSLRDDLASTSRGGILLLIRGRVGDIMLVDNATLGDVALLET